MKELTQVVRGRIEEEAGAPTGNDNLSDKGRADHGVRRVKPAAATDLWQDVEYTPKIVDKTRDSTNMAGK
jgi:hypothetical protein